MSAPQFPATTERSTLCGSLRATDAGTSVTLAGWVQSSRSLGGIAFLTLRDRAGTVQVSFNPDYTEKTVIDAAGAVPLESVVKVEGVVAPQAGRYGESRHDDR